LIFLFKQYHKQACDMHGDWIEKCFAFLIFLFKQYHEQACDMYGD
ncbi:hypothetical protein SAMN02745136_04475, partial [Anaerocolumna jejuensis DSM 15929]